MCFPLSYVRIVSRRLDVARYFLSLGICSSDKLELTWYHLIFKESEAAILITIKICENVMSFPCFLANKLIKQASGVVCVAFLHKFPPLIAPLKISGYSTRCMTGFFQNRQQQIGYLGVILVKGWILLVSYLAKKMMLAVPYMLLIPCHQQEADFRTTPKTKKLRFWREERGWSDTKQSTLRLILESPTSGLLLRKEGMKIELSGSFWSFPDVDVIPSPWGVSNF